MLTNLEKLIYDIVCTDPETTFDYQDDTSTWIASSGFPLDRQEVRRAFVALCKKGLIVAAISNVEGYVDFRPASPTEIISAKQGNVSIPKQLTD